MLKPAVTVLFAVLVTVALPGPADAGKWWEYIDRLSGPGPFLIENTGARICIAPQALAIRRTDDASTASQADGSVYVAGIDRREAYLEFEIGHWKGADNVDFPDETLLLTVTGVFYVPIETIVRRTTKAPYIRGVDVGAGFGVYRFSGDGVKDDHFWAPIVPIRARVTPSELLRPLLKKKGLRRWLSVLHYSDGYDMRASNFDDSKFVSMKPTEKPRRFLRSRGFQLDLSVLFMPE